MSHYLARKTRNLKKTKCLLADLEKKEACGHGRSSDEVKLIEYFYHDDEFSRQCPGNLLLFELTKEKFKKTTHKQTTTI